MQLELKALHLRFSNAANTISSADAAFSSLKVWRDLDQVGITDAGDQPTLTAAGIQSVSLVDVTLTVTSVLNDQILREATFKRTRALTSTLAIPSRPG